MLAVTTNLIDLFVLMDHNDVEDNNALDGYGPQDQLGDLDGQDPYSNLDEEEPEQTPGGDGSSDPEEALYGLAEPLAKPGDVSRQGSNTDPSDTKGSQDQHGYQK